MSGSVRDRRNPSVSLWFSPFVRKDALENVGLCSVDLLSFPFFSSYFFSNSPHYELSFSRLRLLKFSLGHFSPHFCYVFALFLLLSRSASTASAISLFRFPRHFISLCVSQRLSSSPHFAIYSLSFLFILFFFVPANSIYCLFLAARPILLLFIVFSHLGSSSYRPQPTTTTSSSCGCFYFLFSFTRRTPSFSTYLPRVSV